MNHTQFFVANSIVWQRKLVNQAPVKGVQYAHRAPLPKLPDPNEPVMDFTKGPARPIHGFLDWGIDERSLVAFKRPVGFEKFSVAVLDLSRLVRGCCDVFDAGLEEPRRSPHRRQRNIGAVPSSRRAESSLTIHHALNEIVERLDADRRDVLRRVQPPFVQL